VNKSGMDTRMETIGARFPSFPHFSAAKMGVTYQCSPQVHAGSKLSLVGYGKDPRVTQRPLF
jgi:hypothetical protein